MVRSDYQNTYWRMDINSFQRWRAMRDTSQTELGKSRCTKAMADIQARWPQYISADEIA